MLQHKLSLEASRETRAWPPSTQQFQQQQEKKKLPLKHKHKTLVKNHANVVCFANKMHKKHASYSAVLENNTKKISQN